MSPVIRKFALTAHITASVGWLGAALGFLAHAIVGLISQDGQLVRAAYSMMDLRLHLQPRRRSDRSGRSVSGFWFVVKSDDRKRGDDL